MLWHLSQSLKFSTRFERFRTPTSYDVWNAIGRWSEPRTSEKMTPDSRTFWCAIMPSTSSFPAGESVGSLSLWNFKLTFIKQIQQLLAWRVWNGTIPKWLNIQVTAFNYFCRMLKSPMMSASLQAQPGTLQTAATNNLLLSIGTKTHGASTRTRRGRSPWLWACPFYPRRGQSDKKHIFPDRTSETVPTGMHPGVVLAVANTAHSAASQCHVHYMQRLWEAFEF
jgi:hypothetical protein